jgi:hypothetical protein
MGYRVLLIAVTGKDAETVCAEYGVTPTDEYEEIAESPVTGASLPNGSYLLYINDDITPKDGVFARLSKNASLLACYANETTMDCYVASWVNGSEQWSVWHDAQQSLTHLETRGAVPAQLEPIRQRLSAQQSSTADTDYIFDIPIELFVALGGIRYNEDIPDAAPEPWRVLARDQPKNRWWWPFK